MIPAAVFMESSLRRNHFTITVAIVKAIAFAFSIAVISSYNGYYVQGGSLEIGRASTRSVVVSCIAILAFDYVIAALML